MNSSPAQRVAARNLVESFDSVETILLMIERLHRIIQAENEDISCGRFGPDRPDYNRQKSEILLILSRVAPKLEGLPVNPTLRDALESLRGALETNRRSLSFHLRAAQAISALILRAVREDLSDGTYSASSRLQDA